MHPATAPAWRRLAPFLLAPVVILLIVLGLLAGFDPAALRPRIEHRLSKNWGRPVRIGAIRRLDHSPFHATVALEGVRVAQPAWAGRGDMIVLRTATLRLPILPTLFGRGGPDRIELDGLRVALVRIDASHANWKGLGSGGGSGGGLSHLLIRGGQITLDDRKRDHQLQASLSADDRGFRIVGGGTLLGHASTLSLIGAPVTRPGAWPFRVEYRSAIANFSLDGQADHPLDLGHYTVAARAWGDDLAHLDQIIEAGLPGTQPVSLTASVRHDRPDWTIRALKARIGHSDVQLKMSVKKREGRTLLDGDFVSNGFDFSDLASDAGKARAAAKRAAAGPRVVPDTKIDLTHLARTDGTLRYSIRRLLPSGAAVRSLGGTLKLDHGRLVADPLSVTLASGTIGGTASVDQRHGGPLLRLDLRLGGARLEDLLTHADVATGALTAYVRLAGRGKTVRAAIGRASGAIALVAQQGMIGRRAALFLGSDIGRALFEGGEQQTPLRCLIARFDAKGGTATAAPLLIDTGVARVDGAGTIDLSSEQLSLQLRGHPKLAHAISLGAPITITGPIADPHVEPPHVAKTVGTVFKLFGKLITGQSEAPVGDVDCVGEAGRALR